MKSNYLNNPLYRLFAPPLVAIFLYLLILLINDQLSELNNNFRPEEMVFLIVITFSLFESYRVWIHKIEKLFEKRSFGKILNGFVLYSGSFLITIGIILFYFYLYFVVVMGIPEYSAELTTFLIMYSVVGILFHLYYMSIRFLDRQKSLLLKKEEVNRKNIEFELEVFKNKINPEFLFESLESVISLIKRKDVDYAESYIDHLALFYRRILGNRYSEIISLEEEVLKVNEYVKLRNYNYSNNFNVKWNVNGSARDMSVVPNTLLQTIQLIEYSQMIDQNTELNVDVIEEGPYLCFEFQDAERLSPLPRFNVQKQTIVKALGYYSDLELKWERGEFKTRISIPLIELDNY